MTFRGRIGTGKVNSRPYEYCGIVDFILAPLGKPQSAVQYLAPRPLVTCGSQTAGRDGKHHCMWTTYWMPTLCEICSLIGDVTYGGPQSLWYTLRSDLFSVYRTYFKELLNETITSKSALVRASFWSVNAPIASKDQQNIRKKRFLPSKPFFANNLLIL